MRISLYVWRGFSSGIKWPQSILLPLTLFAHSFHTLIGLYKSLALEYASRGITVNTIAPGFIQSPMTDKLDSKQISDITVKIPLNKLGNVEDIAFGALFLASVEASFITGQTLHINGGMLMV